MVEASRKKTPAYDEAYFSISNINDTTLWSLLGYGGYWNYWWQHRLTIRLDKYPDVWHENWQWVPNPNK